ncbi:MAG: hypothetical protein CL760_11890 [Chloroflexi bacterium]|nr:hypothetical protein [Chloroflexota bacterium]|tara:strand:+ start:55063 stop:55521 length:459 start_codon:yes stop_codon:yes gene_type:complete
MTLKKQIDTLNEEIILKKDKLDKKVEKTTQYKASNFDYFFFWTVFLGTLGVLGFVLIVNIETNPFMLTLKDQSYGKFLVASIASMVFSLTSVFLHIAGGFDITNKFVYPILSKFCFYTDKQIKKDRMEIKELRQKRYKLEQQQFNEITPKGE